MDLGNYLFQKLLRKFYNVSELLLKKFDEQITIEEIKVQDSNFTLLHRSLSTLDSSFLGTTIKTLIEWYTEQDKKILEIDTKTRNQNKFISFIGRKKKGQIQKMDNDSNLLLELIFERKIDKSIYLKYLFLFTLKEIVTDQQKLNAKVSRLIQQYFSIIIEQLHSKNFLNKNNSLIRYRNIQTNLELIKRTIALITIHYPINFSFSLFETLELKKPQQNITPLIPYCSFNIEQTTGVNLTIRLLKFIEKRLNQKLTSREYDYILGLINIYKQIGLNLKKIKTIPTKLEQVINTINDYVFKIVQKNLSNSLFGRLYICTETCNQLIKHYATQEKKNELDQEKENENELDQEIGQEQEQDQEQKKRKEKIKLIELKQGSESYNRVINLLTTTLKTKRIKGKSNDCYNILLGIYDYIEIIIQEYHNNNLFTNPELELIFTELVNQIFFLNNDYDLQYFQITEILTNICLKMSEWNLNFVMKKVIEQLINFNENKSKNNNRNKAILLSIRCFSKIYFNSKKIEKKNNFNNKKVIGYYLEHYGELLTKFFEKSFLEINKYNNYAKKQKKIKEMNIGKNESQYFLILEEILKLIPSILPSPKHLFKSLLILTNNQSKKISFLAFKCLKKSINRKLELRPYIISTFLDYLKNIKPNRLYSKKKILHTLMKLKKLIDNWITNAKMEVNNPRINIKNRILAYSPSNPLLLLLKDFDLNEIEGNICVYLLFFDIRIRFISIEILEKIKILDGLLNEKEKKMNTIIQKSYVMIKKEKLDEEKLDEEKLDEELKEDDGGNDNTEEEEEEEVDGGDDEVKEREWKNQKTNTIYLIDSLNLAYKEKNNHFDPIIPLSKNELNTYFSIQNNNIKINDDGDNNHNDNDNIKTICKKEYLFHKWIFLIAKALRKILIINEKKINVLYINLKTKSFDKILNINTKLDNNENNIKKQMGFLIIFCSILNNKFVEENEIIAFFNRIIKLLDSPFQIQKELAILSLGSVNISCFNLLMNSFYKKLEELNETKQNSTNINDQDHENKSINNNNNNNNNMKEKDKRKNKIKYKIKYKIKAKENDLENEKTKGYLMKFTKKECFLFSIINICKISTGQMEKEMIYEKKNIILNLISRLLKFLSNIQNLSIKKNPLLMLKTRYDLIFLCLNCISFLRKNKKTLVSNRRIDFLNLFLLNCGVGKTFATNENEENFEINKYLQLNEKLISNKKEFWDEINNLYKSIMLLSKRGISIILYGELMTKKHLLPEGAVFTYLSELVQKKKKLKNNIIINDTLNNFLDNNFEQLFDIFLNFSLTHSTKVSLFYTNALIQYLLKKKIDIKFLNSKQVGAKFINFILYHLTDETLLIRTQIFRIIEKYKSILLSKNLKKKKLTLIKFEVSEIKEKIVNNCVNQSELFTKENPKIILNVIFEINEKFWSLERNYRKGPNGFKNIQSKQESILKYLIPWLKTIRYDNSKQITIKNFKRILIMLFKFSMKKNTQNNIIQSLWNSIIYNKNKNANAISNNTQKEDPKKGNDDNRINKSNSEVRDNYTGTNLDGIYKFIISNCIGKFNEKYLDTSKIICVYLNKNNKLQLFDKLLNIDKLIYYKFNQKQKKSKFLNNKEKKKAMAIEKIHSVIVYGNNVMKRDGKEEIITIKSTILILLSEIISENLESTKNYLSRIIFLIIINFDNNNNYIVKHCKIILIQLLLSLIVKNKNSKIKDIENCKKLILKLGKNEENNHLNNTSNGNNKIKYWQYEEINELKLKTKSELKIKQFLLNLLTIFNKNLINDDLNDSLIREYLLWITKTNDNLNMNKQVLDLHYYTRIQQLFRCLKCDNKYSLPIFNQLITTLQYFIRKNLKKINSIVLENLKTLEYLLNHLDTITLIPNFFWLSFQLLKSNNVIIYKYGLTFLNNIIANEEFVNEKYQKKLIKLKPKNYSNKQLISLISKSFLFSKLEANLILECLFNYLKLNNETFIESHEKQIISSLVLLIPHLSSHFNLKSRNRRIAKNLKLLIQYTQDLDFNLISQNLENFQNQKFSSKDSFIQKISSNLSKLLIKYNLRDHYYQFLLNVITNCNIIFRVEFLNLFKYLYIEIDYKPKKDKATQLNKNILRKLIKIQNNENSDLIMLIFSSFLSKMKFSKKYFNKKQLLATRWDSVPNLNVFKDGNNINKNVKDDENKDDDHDVEDQDENLHSIFNTKNKKLIIFEEEKKDTELELKQKENTGINGKGKVKKNNKLKPNSKITVTSNIKVEPLTKNSKTRTKKKKRSKRSQSKLKIKNNLVKKEKANKNHKEEKEKEREKGKDQEKENEKEKNKKSTDRPIDKIPNEFALKGKINNDKMISAFLHFVSVDNDVTEGFISDQEDDDEIEAYLLIQELEDEAEDEEGEIPKNENQNENENENTIENAIDRESINVKEKGGSNNCLSDDEMDMLQNSDTLSFSDLESAESSDSELLNQLLSTRQDPVSDPGSDSELELDDILGYTPDPKKIGNPNVNSDSDTERAIDSNESHTSDTERAIDSNENSDSELLDYLLSEKKDAVLDTDPNSDLDIHLNSNSHLNSVQEEDPEIDLNFLDSFEDLDSELDSNPDFDSSSDSFSDEFLN
ncbi:protein furry [Anaeramoeba flamelloides]|uniref:Protein furry n=1 Tax=Anaeramoeba flamelloides TaxID=1746091 RepID=A0AAV8A6D2_9EUKA|nr:protein furry [Anaeramoeba flamelloides]